MENNTIINGELEISLKYIDGLNKYDLIIIDDLNVYLKNKEIMNSLMKHSLIIIGTKEDKNSIYKEFDNKNIKTLRFKGLYMYVIGDMKKYLEKDYSINMINCCNNEVSFKEKSLSIYSVDKRCSFLITKLLNLYNMNEISILDCSKDEEISQTLVFYGHKKNIKMTKISNYTYKTESTYKIYDKKYKKINIC